MKRNKVPPERVAEVVNWQKANDASTQQTADHFKISLATVYSYKAKFKGPKKYAKAKTKIIRRRKYNKQPITIEIPDDVPPASQIGESNHVAIMSLKTFKNFMVETQWR